MKNYPSILLSLLLILCFSFPLSAQHEKDEHHDHAKEKHHSRHKHSFHKHHAALFFGVSSNLDHNTNLATLGADYEYRFIKQFGLGVACEYLFDDNNEELVVGLAMIYHPIKNWKVSLVPLYQSVSHKVDESHGSGHGDETGGASSNNLGIRIGTGYDFHVSKLSITPTINGDFIDGTTILVYGLGFGMGF